MFPDVPIATMRGHKGAVYDLAWDTHSESWFSASGDGVVARWLFGETDGQVLFQDASPFFAIAALEHLVLGGNSSGDLFVGGSGKNTVYNTHKAPIFSLFTDEKNLVWSGDGSGLICVWSRDGHRLRLEHQWPTSLGKIRHLSAHPRGILVAGGSGHWGLLDRKNSSLTSCVKAHKRSCYWALHLPHKRVVLSGGQDGHLSVHREEESLLTLNVHQSAVYRGVIHGQTLWTCGRDKDVKAWSLNSLDVVHKFNRPHSRSVNALALGGPKGAHLATGSDDRSIKVWPL